MLSTVLWPSSQSTISPASLPSALLRTPLHHSLQWMRSLLSPLPLLFPLFPPQQDRKTEEIQQERQGERENGRRQAERDVRISQIFFCCIIMPIHTLKEQRKNQTKEANFTAEKRSNSFLSRLGMDVYPAEKKATYFSICLLARKNDGLFCLLCSQSHYYSDSDLLTEVQLTFPL